MFNVKINSAKTYLPLSMAKGTVEQRFQKARLMNLKFYDKLQDAFVKSEVSQGTFSRILRETSHKDISVKIVNSGKPKGTKLYHHINSKGVNNGYLMALPLTFYKEKIHQSSASVFLKETQNFFNEIFMPKMFKRNLVLLNELPRGKNVIDFYEKNIAGTKELLEDNLQEFLTGLDVSKQINILQHLRYKLLAEQNTAKAHYQIDKRIEKHNNLEYVRSADYYSLDKYGYDEKLQLISTRLKNLLKSERILNKNSKG